jgi:hypothetical protein
MSPWLTLPLAPEQIEAWERICKVGKWKAEERRGERRIGMQRQT